MDLKNIGNGVKYGMVLVLGIIIGGVFCASPVAEPSTLNVEDWKQLKTIDDRAFGLASRMGASCMEGFTAFYNQDAEKAVEVSKKMDAIATETTILAGERERQLQKLGY